MNAMERKVWDLGIVTLEDISECSAFDIYLIQLHFFLSEENLCGNSIANLLQ